MTSDSPSLDTLKEKLMGAVDDEYNVIEPETVLTIISQLETMNITRDQLHATRLGREINNIRQKIDARKKSVQQQGSYPESIIQIAHRAKKLLRSWQGLLTSSHTDSNNVSTSTSSSNSPLTVPVIPSLPPTTPVNGETHEVTSPSTDSNKPRLIVKVKITPTLSGNSNNNDTTKGKRKYESDLNGVATKRRKARPDVSISSPIPPAPISPSPLIEPSNSLPRLKTTQQLLLEMQKTQPDVLSTQTPTVNAILQKQIIDASLHDTGKVDYSALHHGRETPNNNINSTYQKQIPSITHPPVLSPSSSTHSAGSSSKRSALVRCSSSNLLSSNTNWENGSSAGGSPVSPSSSSSSSITSTTSWPLSTNIPEPPSTIPVIPKKKDRRKNLEQPTEIPTSTIKLEQSEKDLATLCASYETVADLNNAHRQRVLAEHDARELEARPDLLLAPIDQLAFVYERERTKEFNQRIESRPTSMTTVEQLNHSSGLIALPFIDCPLEFDLVLDDLVVQQPTMDM